MSSLFKSLNSTNFKGKQKAASEIVILEEEEVAVYESDGSSLVFDPTSSKILGKRTLPTEKEPPKKRKTAHLPLVKEGDFSIPSLIVRPEPCRRSFSSSFLRLETQAESLREDPDSEGQKLKAEIESKMKAFLQLETKQNEKRKEAEKKEVNAVQDLEKERKEKRELETTVSTLKKDKEKLSQNLDALEKANKTSEIARRQEEEKRLAVEKEKETLKTRLNEADRRILALEGNRDELQKLDRKELGAVSKKLRGTLGIIEEMSQESHLCVVCIENSKTILFDCKHVALCESCSKLLTNCPLCRAPTTNKVKIFL